MAPAAKAGPGPGSSPKSQVAPVAKAGVGPGASAKSQAKKAAKEKEPEPTGPAPTRMLVLHGMASGEKIVRTQQMRALFMKTKGIIDMVVYEGEIECVPGSSPSGEAYEALVKYFRGKPMMTYDEIYFDERNWRCYRNVRETLGKMQAFMKANGPFDGIIGFSIGANFAIMLAAQSFTGAGEPVSFVIPMCPNPPGYADQVRELFLRPVETPALIIRGSEEDYIQGLPENLKGKQFEKGEAEHVSDHSVELFKDPETFMHPDGHKPMPGTPADQEELIAKIMEFVERKRVNPPVVLKDPAPLPLWRVPDGSGGRVVRFGYGLESLENPDTLRPGALVQEIELRGTRLHYNLIAGHGPQVGWVTTKSSKGNLLVRAPPDAAGTTGDIWIVTVGTRGDLQPFVVLGMALQAAGYTVRLFGPPELSAFSKASGLRVTTVCRGWSDRSQAGLQVKKPSESETLAAAERDWELEAAVQEAAEGPSENAVPGVKEPAMGWGNFFGLLKRLGIDTDNGGDVVNLAWLWTEMPKAIRTIEQEMQGGKPDLLIFNHLMVNVGLLARKKYGVRSIFANLGLEFHFAPRGEDSFNYNTLGAFDRLDGRKASGGVCPMKDLTKDEFRALYNSKDRLLGTTKLIIYALPHEDQVVAKDWKFTGFWIYDEEKQKDDNAVDAFGGHEVMSKLQEFLIDGPAPVYMGWGSMPTTPGLILILMQALVNLGLRAVMVRGWGNLSMDALRAEASAWEPDRMDVYLDYAENNVLFIDKAPHEWLLKRCSCSVHHGGAGTTAAAMRAGVPTIVVPLGYDQPVHGQWVERLGVGVKTTKMSSLEAPEFEAALLKVTTDAEMNAKARNTAEVLKKEPGVSAAVEKVRKIMREDVRTLKWKTMWEAQEEELKKKKTKDTFWDDVKKEQEERNEKWAKKMAEEEERLAEEEKERLKQERRQRAAAEAIASTRAAPPPPAAAQPEPRQATAAATVASPPPAEPQERQSEAVPEPTPAPPVEEPPQAVPEPSPAPPVEEPLQAVPEPSPAPPAEEPPQAVPEPSPAPPAEEPPQAAPEPVPVPAPEDPPKVEEPEKIREEEPKAAEVVQPLEPPAEQEEQAGTGEASERPEETVQQQGGTGEPLQPPPLVQRSEDLQSEKPIIAVQEEIQKQAEKSAPPEEAIPSELTVWIDRGLELKMVVEMKPDMVVLEVKQRLARDDPTGETSPEDFCLLDPFSRQVLADDVVVHGVYAELEIGT